jgi:hypothetical protein
MSPSGRGILWSSFAGILLLAAPGRADVPAPTVSGPISSAGSAFITPPSSLALSEFGYVEEEFFVAGTARAYTAGALGTDGSWAAAPDGATAAYKTRILVRRPTSPKKFNGTVLVEWLNVSGGLDAAPDWTFVHPFLKREGWAWVGVSAQFQGVAGTNGPLGLNLSLKAVNPARYGSLEHPGDSFSYDIFSQVAQAIRTPVGPDPLGELDARRVIAIGESQSASRLTTYVNAVHPDAHVYDGYLIHSRGGGASSLSQSPQPSIQAPTPSLIRGDVDVPVLVFETETDLISLGFFAARQPDAGNLRLWEVAGTAHDDAYGLSVGPDDPGEAALDTTYLPPVTSVFGVINCALPINQGPQHYVLNAALRRLNRWVRKGKVSGGPIAPRLEVSAGPPPEIQRDAFGNALGGIRTPQVDVPIATLSGLGQPPGGFCAIFGTTVPFDAATLASLYPTHDAYVKAIVRSARQASRAGFVTRVDTTAIKAAAKASEIGG